MCVFSNCNLFANAGEEPAEKSQPSDTSGFNKRLFIGIWSPNYADTKESADIEYKLIADAGINLIWSERYGDDAMTDYKLKISEPLGLKHIMPVWAQPQPNQALQDADDARWKAIVTKYKDYPAVIGFDMRDEPPYSDLSYYFVAREYIESQIQAEKFAICNLFPTYCTDSRIGPLGYEHYLTTYLEGVKPRILSFDNYPLVKSTAPDDQINPTREFINNLIVIRREALKANIPFWGFIQAQGWIDNRLPSKNEMRWLNNMHIVFGADGFSYFLWAENNYYHGAPVTATHVPTERYDIFKQLNQELRAYDFMFVPFRQEGFILKNLMANYSEVIPENLRKESYGHVKSIVTTGEMINGCFEADGQKALYLFNFDIARPITAKVIFDSRRKFELWGKGGFESGRKEARSLKVSLEPGEGKFLIF